MMNLVVEMSFGDGACGKGESGQDQDPPPAVQEGDWEKRNQERIFVAEILAGAVFVNGTVAPPDGFNSMFISVLAGTGATKNVISACSPGFRNVTLLVPVFAVKSPVEVLVLYMRGTGKVPGVEKVICIFVKSTPGLQGSGLMVNLISSIPASRSDARPLTSPIILMPAAGCSLPVHTVPAGVDKGTGAVFIVCAVTGTATVT